MSAELEKGNEIQAKREPGSVSAELEKGNEIQAKRERGSVSDVVERRAAARRQAELVSSIRRLVRPGGGSNGAPAPAAEEHCDLCGKPIEADHRHLIHLVERQILCSCESCLALRGGDPELRPTGTRVVWLESFELDDESWAAFQIPIGLAFFFRSGAGGETVALYPSPAGATECELDLGAWQRLVTANPVLAGLEPDAEALIVNRLASPPEHAIAPIDECYRLVGLIKTSWEGISGGAGPQTAIDGFFAELRERAA